MTWGVAEGGTGRERYAGRQTVGVPHRYVGRSEGRYPPIQGSVLGEGGSEVRTVKGCFGRDDHAKKRVLERGDGD